MLSYVSEKQPLQCQESWRGGEVAPYNGLNVEAPTERHNLCRLKPKRVGISLIEVYERVGKAVRSVKGPKRADRRILWLWGATKLPGLVSVPLPFSRVRVGIGQC